ncbi:MAG: PGF-pre-PGF domain-containing protein [Candidatus Aenigmarchaeota archaeon]|nr:PGF-pre-PGF domain-containing protein [Candidatus Aenigmarchaeota archaeon]
MDKNKTNLLKYFITASIVLLFSVSLAYATPLPGTNADVDRVWFNSSSDFLNSTANASNADINNVKFPNLTSESLYLGMEYIFIQANFSVSTAGVVGATGSQNVSWEYSNGTSNESWKSLTIVTNTCQNFTAAGNCSIIFNPPTDWSINTWKDRSLYWIRVNGTGNYSTNASVAQISVIEYNVAFNVTDQLGSALNDTAFTTFKTNDTNGVYSTRRAGKGWELALQTGVQHDISVNTTGYVNATKSTTSNANTSLFNLTNFNQSFTIKILNITDELGNVLAPLNGAAGIIVSDNGSVTYENNIAYINASNDNNLTRSINLNASKAGYVNKSSSVAGVSSLGQNVTNVSNLLFTIKVLNISDELDNRLLSLNGVAGIVVTDSGFVTYSADVAYINASAATTNLNASKSGYVNRSSFSIAGVSNGGQNSTNISGLKFTVRINNLTDELGNKLSLLNGVNGIVVTDSGVVTYSGDVAYINASAATTNLNGSKSGYVNQSLTVAGVSNAAQNFTNISNLKFTIRVNNLTDELGNKLQPLNGVAGIVVTDSGVVTYSADVAYINASAATTNLNASKSGYVNKTLVVATSNANQNFTNVSGVQFTIKISNLRDELSNNLAPLNGVAGIVVTDSGFVTYSADVAYINASAATTNLNGSKSGYVNSSLAVPVSNSVQNNTNITNLKFTIKISNLRDELSNNLAPLNGVAGIVVTDSGFVTYSADVAYINASAATTNLNGSKSGYVNKTLVVATSNANQNFTNVSGLLFTVKVLNITDELGHVIVPLNGVVGSIVTTNGSVTYNSNIVYINASSSPNLTASRSGYLNVTLSGVGISNSAQNVTSISNLAFTIKITNVTNELGNRIGDLDGSTVVLVSSSGDVQYSGGVAYINASTTASINASSSGYVNQTKIVGVALTQNSTTISSLPFTLKILVVSDGGQALTDASITLSKSGVTITSTPTTRVSNAYYYAINQSTFSTLDFTVTDVGYIAETRNTVAIDTANQKLQSITLNSAPSGGGSSGGSTTPSVPTASSSIDKLTNDVPSSVVSTLKESALVKLDITLNSDQTGVNLIFSKPSTNPVSVAPSGNVYQYISVSHNIQESKFKSVRFVFNVDKSWLTSNSIDTSKVSLERYETDHWTKYGASMVSQNDTSVSYETTVPGLSNFAVTGEKQLTECTSGKRCDGNQIQECTNNLWVTSQTCQYGCDSTTYNCNPQPVDQPVQEPQPTTTPKETTTETTPTQTTSEIPMTYVYAGLGLLVIVVIAGVAYWKMKKPVKYAGYKK